MSAPPKLPKDASAYPGVDDARELPPIMMEMEVAGPGVGESEGEETEFDGEDPAHLLDPEDARELEDLVHAEAAAHAEDADMPEWCPETRFVTRPSDRTRILGNISRIHEGTAGERLSVYCRLHQCSFLVPGWEAATIEGVCQWFHHVDCNMLPGKDNEAAHKASWDLYAF